MSGLGMNTAEQQISTDVFPDSGRGSETLEVRVPRGEHGVYVSPRLAGHHKASCKKYAVQIQPHGHVKGMKAVLRDRGPSMEALPTAAELDPGGRVSGQHEDETLSPILRGGLEKREHFFEKARFREGRAERFEVDRRFPALVTPRLVPSWGGDSSPERLRARQKVEPEAAAKARRLHEPTLGFALKCQLKKSKQDEDCVHNGVAWSSPGNAGTTEIREMYARHPMRHEDEYRENEVFSFWGKGSADGRSNWVGDKTILPTSIAEAKSSCDFNRERIDVEVGQMRSRGRAYRETLQNHYDQRREKYKKKVEERGPLSGFERREKAWKQKQLAEAPTTNEPQSNDTQRRSVVYSRFDISKLVLPSSDHSG